MNLAILKGRLIKDPELKFTSGKGTALTNFTMAVDKGFGDNKKTAFIPVVVWGKSAEAVANYTKKGSMVLVRGSIETRSYDAKDGSKRYVTEVVADMYEGVEFLDGKSNNNTSNTQNGDVPGDYFGASEVDNSDMPF